jgi:hypothetical protein
MGESANAEFEFTGVNHLAPVCRDVHATGIHSSSRVGRVR